MALVPVKDKLGLWQDQGWKKDTPGLYAVIVGITNYPHFEGGSAPAINTFELKQLEVSAQTAAAVFEWLRSDYRYTDLPVVWCYLLLSPSEVEKKFLQKRKINHYENPTEINLRVAIKDWCQVLPKKNDPASKSRTLFFFSGHGVGANWNPLILPSDYLSPPDSDPILENCFSVKEMREWMETHPVAEHLAFIDSCRNEFSPLATKGSKAHGVFPDIAPGPTPRVVATLSATSPNSTAFQSNEEDYTFFGKALIEGLRGGEANKSVRKAGTLDVEFENLVKYVKPRIVQILQHYNPDLVQMPRPYCNPSDERLIVTQLPSGAPKQVRKITRGLSTSIKPPIGLTEESLVEEAEKIQDSHFNSTFKTPPPLSALRDVSTAHGHFGHEYASIFWGHLKLYSLSNGSLLDDDKLHISTVSLDNKNPLVRVDIKLSGPDGGILAAFENGVRGLLAVPLPTDNIRVSIPDILNEIYDNRSIPIRLTLSSEYRGLLHIDAQLGPSEIYHYKYLWDLSRIVEFGSFADAAKKADPNILRDAVSEKVMAPTAAIAGSIILAYGGKIRLIHDWTRNLMNWFPLIPDGVVLWAESLRIAMADGEKKPFHESDPLGAMAEAIGLLRHRGVPFFADALDLLDRQLRYLESKKGDLSRSQLNSLNAVRRMTDQVMQVASPAGQFLMLAAVPRPAGMGKSKEPLSIKEMFKLLRPSTTQKVLDTLIT